LESSFALIADLVLTIIIKSMYTYS